MEKTKIVITSNSNKKGILRNLSRSKLLYNLKFYTFRELKKKLFFDYDSRALEYIIKNYGVSLAVARIYMDNMYFLENIRDEKVKFLNKLKQDLEDNNLLIKCENFIGYIKDKTLIVYGYDELTLEQQLILNKMGINYELKENENNLYMPQVFQANSISEEVRFVVNKISELLHEGISIDKIKLIMGNDYNNTVRRYFNIYKIPINLEDNSSFYCTLVAKEFLSNYEERTIEDNIDCLREKYDNVNDLVNIINKSVLVDDKNIRKEFIIEDLKKASIKKDKYDRAIEVASLDDDFSDDTYVFLLGFNINAYPKVQRDDDYLSDNVKTNLGIDTSTNINRIEKRNLMRKLKSIKNLTITYKLSNGKVVFYPSTLLKEMNLEVSKIEFNKYVSYSQMDTMMDYARDLDNLYKFNEVSVTLALYRENLNIAYREFNNVFSGINEEKYRQRINYELALNYTNMEMYNECAFKYYLSKVLKIDIYEENFKAIIGTIVHHILELGLVKDIDITHEIIKFVKEQEYELNKREYFYLEKLGKELKEILTILKEQESKSKLNNYLFESELYVYKDRDDIKVTFKGLIDKVMYNNVDDKEILAVVDYKTGNTFITLDNIKYGLNIQTPIYLYLLRKSDRFKGATIAGFYIQKVLESGPPSIVENKSIDDIRRDNLKLNGFTNSATNIMELVDSDYLDGKIIKGLSFKTNGELKASAKVLSNKEMDEVVDEVDEKIEECISNIIEAKFDINPKVIKDKNVACTFCKFKDICFMSKKDEVVLKEEMEVETNEVD